MTTMRLEIKPAAASAAAAFLLLLILDLTWPGHGIWLLVIGILLALSAAGLWYWDRLAAEHGAYPQQPRSPFLDVGAYGLSGARVPALRKARVGVPVAAVVAPVAALSILLFIGGSLGSSESATTEAVTAIQQDVMAIDRSGDSELQTPQVQPPTAHQTQQAQTSTAVNALRSANTAVTEEDSAIATAQSSNPIKPIVVDAPQPASGSDQDAEVEEIDPRALSAVEYTVEEGDTLYDIAERYGSSVEAIMGLNKLDAFSFIHPGDVLLIPQVDVQNEDPGEES